MRLLLTAALAILCLASPALGAEKDEVVFQVGFDISAYRAYGYRGGATNDLGFGPGGRASVHTTYTYFPMGVGASFYEADFDSKKQGQNNASLSVRTVDLYLSTDWRNDKNHLLYLRWIWGTVIESAYESGSGGPYFSEERSSMRGPAIGFLYKISKPEEVFLGIEYGRFHMPESAGTNLVQTITFRITSLAKIL